MNQPAPHQATSDSASAVHPVPIHTSPPVFADGKDGDPCGVFVRLGQGLFYLALGAWFGAMVMLAIGAAAAFTTTRGLDPTLGAAPWNQPGLVEQSSSILAGSIVGKSLQGLAVVQIVCACAAVLGLISQCTFHRNYLLGGARSITNIVRIILIAIPVLILLADLLYFTPQIYHWRDIMWDMNQTQAVRVEAHEHFDHFHHLTERVVGFSCLSLIGAVLASALVLRITPDPSFRRGKRPTADDGPQA
jgi:hypothetical protein